MLTLSGLKWAGIGSRNTPVCYYGLLTAIGFHLAKGGAKLYSGAAEGPDKEFERGVIRYMRDFKVRNLMEIWLPWTNFGKRPIDGNHYKVLQKPDYDFARHILNDSGVCVAPWFNNMGIGPRKLFARNVFQILTGDWSKVDLVIYYAEENREKGKVSGGTRIAVYLARHLEIPTYNLAIAADRNKLFELIGFSESANEEEMYPIHEHEALRREAS